MVSTIPDLLMLHETMIIYEFSKRKKKCGRFKSYNICWCPR